MTAFEFIFKDEVKTGSELVTDTLAAPGAAHFPAGKRYESSWCQSTDVVWPAIHNATEFALSGHALHIPQGGMTRG